MKSIANILILLLAACGGGGGGAGGSSGPPPSSGHANGITVPSGFTIQTIAQVPGARELAPLPNGDLLVGTVGTVVYIVPQAESAGMPGNPTVFATINDAPDAGITYVASLNTIYVGTTSGVYSIPYSNGEQQASSVTKIAGVRTGPISPTTDGDVHTSTSVAFTNGTLYASVGSSCNACVEVDPTRASIQQMSPAGTNMKTRATRIRNAIALAVNPATGTLWAGGAGQDNLPAGHPYEYLDGVTLHAGVADYGWPGCEENNNNFGSGANCASTVIPSIELPAYSTIIGAAFYPRNQTGTYAFASSYGGGLFVAVHGSWHDSSTTPGLNCSAAAQVVFVPMNGDAPATPVNWQNPNAQWQPFVTGFQNGCGTSRIGRPTGVAVGPQGSLFVGDDQNGVIYRIRP